MYFCDPMLHFTDIIIFAPLLLNSKKPIEVSEHCYLQVKKEYCNQMKITKINIKIKETRFDHCSYSVRMNYTMHPQFT